MPLRVNFSKLTPFEINIQYENNSNIRTNINDFSINVTRII